jgi:hypothetical protein
MIELWADDNSRLRVDIELVRRTILRGEEQRKTRRFRSSPEAQAIIDKDILEECETALKSLRAWRKKWGDSNCSQVLEAYMTWASDNQFFPSRSVVARDIQLRRELNFQIENRYKGWLEELKNGRKVSWRKKDMHWDDIDYDKYDERTCKY